MKKTILSIYILIAISVYTHAQYDLTDFATNGSTSTRVQNNGGDLFYSANFSNSVNPGLHVVNLNSTVGPDTIYFPVTIAGDIFPVGSNDISYDTLTIEIAVGYWGNGSDASIKTLDADFTVKNRYNSYDYVKQSRSQSGTSEIYNEFKFVEGETDTLRVIVTAGLLSLDNLFIRSSNATVVANLGFENQFFEDENVTISNPVENGLLTISVPENTSSATVALVSLDGSIIETKEITSKDNSINVESLNGVYYLRELTTGSTKKIIIK